MCNLSYADVCLKESMTLADRLSNLQLVQDFCREKLDTCCHFTLEDMLYANSSMKVRHNHIILHYNKMLTYA